MGGEYRTIRVVGKDFDSAWSSLQEEEKEERGSDFYNGSIYHVHDVKKLSPSEYDDNIKKEVSLAKCTGIMKEVKKPIDNTNKIKTQVTNYPQKGTRKWVTKYVVKEKFSYEEKGSFDNQTDAIKRARQLCEKTHITYIVQIAKVLIGSDYTVAGIDYKRSSDQRDGEWEVYCLVPW